MPRPLYGYRVVSGLVLIDAPAAAVVATVLAVPKQRRHGIACRVARSLLPHLSDSAIFRLVARIRSHSSRYQSGQPFPSSLPSIHLRLLHTPLNSAHSTPARLRGR